MNRETLRNVGLGVGVLAVSLAAGYALMPRRDERNAEASPSPSGGPAPVPSLPRPVAVVWAGPVSREQVKGADLGAGVPVFHVTCTGDGKPSCAQIADSYKDAEGRRLPGLRRALKLPEGPLVLAAFSAGGHLVWRLLEHPADRAEVVAVALADATYTTGWQDKAAGKAAPIRAYVDYAAEIAEQGASRLFVATASSAPNKDHPTGAQTLRAIAEAIGATRLLGGGVATTASAAQSWVFPGGMYLIDYGAAYSHAEHATKLAQIIWTELVKPRFQQGEQRS